MGAKTSEAAKQAWGVARGRNGIVTRSELLRLGFSAKAIRHRLSNGRLHRVHRGVYAVGRPQIDREQRWLAAVLLCGEGAALSHRSAGALWGFVEDRAGEVDVSVRGRGEPRARGIRARTRPSLPATDVVVHGGIPVTRPGRTLLDLAAEISPRTLERAVNEADKLDLIDPERLRDELAAWTGLPGVRALRALLDRDTFRLSDSELEVRFRAIAAQAGLRQPRTKAMVNGFEVDFYWPDLRLVVETDGLRYHRTPSAQARDQLRDQTHTAAGLTTLRFTHRQVTREPGRVRRVLTDTVRLKQALPT